MTTTTKRDFPILAHELATLVKGQLFGEPDQVITGICEIEDTSPQKLSVIWSPLSTLSEKVLTQVYKTFIVGKESLDTASILPASMIVVDHPQVIFAYLTQVFEPAPQLGYIHPTAIIHATARIDSTATIGAFVQVKSFATIGPLVRVDSHCLVGEHVSIGAYSHIHSGVKILADVVIGKEVIIYPNTVIGSDGFGFVPHQGRYEKIVHRGRVVIQDGVEIGSNCTVDKGVLGDTIIGEGCKLDNLIHVAHGVVIESHVVIAAQTGISGSAQIGSYARIGGQVGIVGHIKIAKGSQIQAKSGLASNITVPNKKWYGYPAIEYWNYLRSFAWFKRMPELAKRIEELERNAQNKS